MADLAIDPPHAVRRHARVLRPQTSLRSLRKCLRGALAFRRSTSGIYRLRAKTRKPSGTELTRPRRRRRILSRHRNVSRRRPQSKSDISDFDPVNRPNSQTCEFGRTGRVEYKCAKVSGDKFIFGTDRSAKFPANAGITFLLCANLKRDCPQKTTKQTSNVRRGWEAFDPGRQLA